MKDFDDIILHPTQEPEIITLGNQTIEEVKEILKKSKTIDHKKVWEEEEKCEKKTKKTSL